MFKYSTIAAGTDGTETALVAVRKAASMAKAYGAKLVIVCAYYEATGSLLSSPSTDSSSIPVVSKERADEFLADAEAVAKEEGATAIELLSLDGPPVMALTESLRETGAELLVLGNRGIHSLAGRVFGNIPTGVVRHSPIDVMVVNTENEIV